MRWFLSLLALLLLSGAGLAAPQPSETTVLQLEEQQRLRLASQAMADPRGDDPLDQVSRVELREPQVRVWDDHTAIVTGVWEIAGVQAGRPVEASRRFTHLWVRVGGDWQLRSRHLASEDR